jgi:predicted nucleotide-binding protein
MQLGRDDKKPHLGNIKIAQRPFTLKAVVMTTSPPSLDHHKVGDTQRPSLFIGSSKEGLDFAQAARGLLTQDADITLWNEGFFALGQTFIETLLNALPRFDFALLIITPDDFVRAREVEGFGPRDNVIFELGLFMGTLGRSRTFLIHQSGPIKLPTDLSGMMAAEYDWPADDRNHQKAIAVACDMIRNQIRGLGMSEAKIGRDIRQLESRQDRHERELSRQRAEIRALQVVLASIVTRYELDKLMGLSRERPFLVRYSPDMMTELRRLRAMELIDNHREKGIRAIEQRYRNSNEEFDLREYFYVTEHGMEYLELRELISESSGE